MGYGNTGAVANESYASKAPERMPLIAIEMDRQAKALSHLHSIIGDLESRLSPVIRSVGPDAVSARGNDLKPPTAVPFAGNLSEQNIQIEGACTRLQSIFDRIEL